MFMQSRRSMCNCFCFYFCGVPYPFVISRVPSRSAARPNRQFLTDRSSHLVNLHSKVVGMGSSGDPHLDLPGFLRETPSNRIVGQPNVPYCFWQCHSQGQAMERYCTTLYDILARGRVPIDARLILCFCQSDRAGTKRRRSFR